jgi:hypothetical protein
MPARNGPWQIPAAISCRRLAFIQLCPRTEKSGHLFSQNATTAGEMAPSPHCLGGPPQGAMGKGQGVRRELILEESSAIMEMGQRMEKPWPKPNDNSRATPGKPQAQGEQCNQFNPLQPSRLLKQAAQKKISTWPKCQKDMTKKYIDGKSDCARRAGDNRFQPGNMIDQWIGNHYYRKQQQDGIEHLSNQ